MYILERLIGVGSYAFTLVLVYFLLAWSTIDCKWIFRFYTAALCGMAFCYQPYITADLHRIYGMIRTFSHWNFSDFFQQFVVGSTIPSARLFYWCVGKIGYPELLPAAACLICYRCIFYMVMKTMQREQISRAELAAAVFFFMSTGSYMMLISNIRTMLSFTLIVFCFYRESVEGKYRISHLLLYLIAVTMHNAGAVMAALRLCLLLIDRRRTLGRRIIGAAALCCAAVWCAPLLQPMAADIGEKFRFYVLGDQYSYLWEYIIGAVVLAVQLWVISRVRRSGSGMGDCAGLNWFLLLCVVIALTFWFEFSVFYRLVNCMGTLLMLPLLMAVLRDERMRGRGETACAAVTLMAGCLLILVCSRGSLCSLKFFVL